VEPAANSPLVTPSSETTTAHRAVPIRSGATAVPAVALPAGSNTVSCTGSPVDSATQILTRVRVRRRTIGPHTTTGSWLALIG
jgi:hypothetical protein